MTLAIVGLLVGVTRGALSMASTMDGTAREGTMSRAQPFADATLAALRAASCGLGVALLAATLAIVLARRASAGSRLPNH